MPNPIKYTTGSETLALKKGNFYIGTGDVGKGPSNTTGYYNGVSPSSGGYVIYLNKSGAPGDLSYHNAANDSELISFTNNLAGQSFTSATQCLVYYVGQTDKVVLNSDYGGIITSGLTHLYDFGFTPSYPRTNTTVYNLISSNNGSLINSPSFISDNGGAITCDGSDDYITTDITIEACTNSNLQTICVWLKGGFISGADAYDNNSFTGSDANMGGQFHLIIAYYQSNTIWFTQSWYGGSNELNYYATVTPQSWNYMVMVKKAVETYDVYYNGSLVMENCVRIANISSKFNIGRWWSGEFVRSQGTSIVSNYNRVLSSSEILQNYNAQKGRFGL